MSPLHAHMSPLQLSSNIWDGTEICQRSTAILFLIVFHQIG